MNKLKRWNIGLVFTYCSCTTSQIKINLHSKHTNVQFQTNHVHEAWTKRFVHVRAQLTVSIRSSALPLCTDSLGLDYNGVYITLKAHASFQYFVNYYCGIFDGFQLAFSNIFTTLLYAACINTPAILAMQTLMLITVFAQHRLHREQRFLAQYLAFN